jgi:cytochrome P450
MSYESSPSLGDFQEMELGGLSEGEMSMALQGSMVDLSNPQPAYAQLIEAGGFFEVGPGMYLSHDRENTQFVLRHHELFSSNVEMSLGNVRPLIPLNVDPPNHSKYRKLLDPMFAPRKMEAQEQYITDRANAFIDSFIDKGSCNFSEEFAELFPSSIFLGLLGLPQDYMDEMLNLRDHILHPEKINPDAALDFDVRRQVMDTGGQMIYDFVGKLIDQRTEAPADDIITTLLTTEVGGDKMTREDILDLMFLFIIAGLDTVSDSLTCFFAYLAQHPEKQRELVDSPEVIASAVEELLRWESPVPTGVPRVATEDVTLPGGQQVPKGAAVLVSYGAADMDPGTFPEPFDVDFERAPNNHIAFGGGVHRCLGSHLARRELRVVLREWHRRIPSYRITPGHEHLEYPSGLRHVKDLMLSWD